VGFLIKATINSRMLAEDATHGVPVDMHSGRQEDLTWIPPFQVFFIHFFDEHYSPVGRRLQALLLPV
jgi:hypothetical protein